MDNQRNRDDGSEIRDMIRVAVILPDAIGAADTVILDLEARRKRRHVVETVMGERILIDLSEAPNLRDGNGLQLEDGRLVEVRAVPEELVEIASGDPLRIAWHLGNRHVPTQILGERMRIRADHVIERMLRGLGCELRNVTASFEPEGGAYAHHHRHD